MVVVQYIHCEVLSVALFVTFLPQIFLLSRLNLPPQHRCWSHLPQLLPGCDLQSRLSQCACSFYNIPLFTSLGYPLISRLGPVPGGASGLETSEVGLRAPNQNVPHMVILPDT